MFRPIRRKKKEMDIDAAKELLQCSRRGVLAVNGDDGYPYAVPVNYFYDSDAGKIYFHGARVGHKVDALKASDKVCFTCGDLVLTVAVLAIVLTAPLGAFAIDLSYKKLLNR